jgi:hypothetical protein
MTNISKNDKDSIYIYLTSCPVCMYSVVVSDTVKFCSHCGVSIEWTGISPWDREERQRYYIDGVSLNGMPIEEEE